MWYLYFFTWLLLYSPVIFSSIHIIANGKILFYGWIIHYSICIPYFISLSVTIALRLFQFLGYCKECNSKHEDICLFNILTSFPLDMFPGLGLLSCMIFMFLIIYESLYIFYNNGVNLHCALVIFVISVSRCMAETTKEKTDLFYS